MFVCLLLLVRDGNRNEQLGVIIMGPEGPEFYTKNQNNVPASDMDHFENKRIDLPSRRFFFF